MGPNDGLGQVSGDAASHSAHGPSGDVAMSEASAFGEEGVNVQPEELVNVQPDGPVVVEQPEKWWVCSVMNLLWMCCLEMLWECSHLHL